MKECFDFLRGGVKRFGLGGSNNKRLKTLKKAFENESIELLAGIGATTALSLLGGGSPLIAGAASFAVAVLINYYRDRTDNKDKKHEFNNAFMLSGEGSTF